MKDYNTTADDLYRIHCYADTLAKLCATGNSPAIDPEKLEQIFKDIATFTDLGASALYSASDNIKPSSNIARDLALGDKTNPDPLSTPFIKSHNILGKPERIYVPEYVDANGLTLTEVLMQGVILNERYNHYSIKDFKLWMHAKDSFKEVYFLVPLPEPRFQHECENDYYKRVGIKIVRQCIQA